MTSRTKSEQIVRGIYEQLCSSGDCYKIVNEDDVERDTEKFWEEVLVTKK